MISLAHDPPPVVKGSHPSYGSNRRRPRAPHSAAFFRRASVRQLGAHGRGRLEFVEPRACGRAECHDSVKMARSTARARVNGRREEPCTAVGKNCIHGGSRVFGTRPPPRLVVRWRKTPRMRRRRGPPRNPTRTKSPTQRRRANARILSGFAAVGIVAGLPCPVRWPSLRPCAMARSDRRWNPRVIPRCVSRRFLR